MKIKSRLLTCMFELGLISESVNKLLELDLTREQTTKIKEGIRGSALGLLENLALSLESLDIPFKPLEEEPPEEEKPKRNIFDPNDPVDDHDNDTLIDN